MTAYYFHNAETTLTIPCGLSNGSGQTTQVSTIIYSNFPTVSVPVKGFLHAARRANSVEGVQWARRDYEAQLLHVCSPQIERPRCHRTGKRRTAKAVRNWRRPT